MTATANPPKRTAAAAVAAWLNIFKSIPADQLEDLKEVEDLWNEAGGQFANPSRTEIKTGRPQESSGGGAERMVREYSDPAPQMGMAEKYAEFSGMLRDFGKAQQTTQAQVFALAQMIKGLTDPAKPAAKALDTESVLAKAEGKLRKARAELRKAEMADEEDKEEREEAKSFLDQAGVALKAAKRLLVKAEDEEWGEDDEERAEKARGDYLKLTKALRKAEDEGTEREKKEEDEMEKARKLAADTASAKAATEAAASAATAAAAKAATEKAEHGGEATEEKKDDEKAEKARIAAEAAAKAADLAPIDPGLRDQIQVMSTTLKGLMDVVMAGSKGRPMPTFIKSTPIATLGATVEAAIEDGRLDDPLEILKAQTLMTHVRAVQAGQMDAAVVDDEIARAPTNVRQLFAPAQAAA